MPVYQSELAGRVAISGLSESERGLRSLGGAFDAAGASAENSGGRFDRIGAGLGTMGRIAGGLAVGGIAAVGAGFGAAAFTGLSFNNSMEQATAKINAFTKDGEKTAGILDMVRDRAAKTPFAFEEMANAAASLGPAALQSGAPLEELIGLSEILAASNPAQGLEGGVVALKEALGGDFVSIVERFNLPKQRLQELKEQGVPALEAVSIAMKEMGLDADLVSNMANTMAGRWSTFQDSLTTLAATATAPIFEGLSSGLGDLQTKIDANMPRLEEFATAIGERLGAAFSWVIDVGVPGLIGAFQSISGAVTGVVDTVTGVIDQIKTAWAIGEAFGGSGLQAAVNMALDIIRGFGTNVLTWITEQAAAWAPQLATWGAAFAQWALDAIPQLMLNLAEYYRGMYAWINESLPGWLTAIGQFAAPAIQWVLDAIPGLLENLATFVQTMINTVLTNAPQLAATFLQYGIAAVSWIADKLPDLANNLGQFFNSMVNWVVSSLPEWGQNLAKLGAQAAQWVLDALPGLATNLGEMTGKLIGWALQTAIDVVPKLAAMGVKFVAWVATDVLPALPGALKTIWDALVAFVSAASVDIVPKLTEMGTRFYNWVTVDVMPKLPGALANIWNGLTSWVATTTADLGPKILTISMKFIDWVATDVLPKLPGALAAIWNGLTGWISTTAADLGPKIVAMSAKFIDWVATDVIPKLPGALDAIKTSIGEWITGAATWAAGALKGIGESLVQGLIDGINAVVDDLKGVLTGITDMIPDLKGPPERDAKLLFDNGRLIMQGLISGIESQETVLQRTLAGITADIGGSARWDVTSSVSAPALAPMPLARHDGYSARSMAPVVNHYTYHVTGNYKNQSVRTIRDELRLLAMATPSLSRP